MARPKTPLLDFKMDGPTVGTTMSRTHTWSVFSAQNRTFLGRVAWKNGWRRYVMHTAPGTLFDAGCLREIAQFCEDETREQQARAAARRRAEGA